MKYFTDIPFPAALLLLALGSSTLPGQTGRADRRVLDSIAAAGVLDNRAVGLVAAVVRGNDTLLLKGYGKANLEWGVPMPTDAMFEVGSLAKQFTAAAILQLRDAGKLALDDEITRWFPDLDTQGNTVTLRRLLSHSSGINHFADGDEWANRFWNPRTIRDSLLPFITLAPFQYPTGQAQAYSNSGFYLLGLVVEKASGMSYEQYVATKIFEPLGMKRSMYCNSGENVPRRAHGYGVQGPTIRRAPTFNHTVVFAAGAICSTAPDLVIWLQALHGGKVLSPKSYAEMTTPSTLADGTALQYGMGIKVAQDHRGLTYVGHGGTSPGFRAEAAWYPQGQMAVVVLTNSSPAALSPGTVGGALAAEVLPWPRPALQFYTGDASILVGKYQWTMGGNQPPLTIEVTQGPNGPLFSPNGGRAQPLPWKSGLTFQAGESATLTFRRGSGGSGPVTELRRDDQGNHYILKKQ